MTENAVYVEILPEQGAEFLRQDALGAVKAGCREVVLDFSRRERIGPAMVDALEELAAAGESNGVTITLHNMNIEVYRVLKVVRLAQRFSFKH